MAIIDHSPEQFVPVASRDHALFAAVARDAYQPVTPELGEAPVTNLSLTQGVRDRIFTSVQSQEITHIGPPTTYSTRNFYDSPLSHMRGTPSVQGFTAEGMVASGLIMCWGAWTRSPKVTIAGSIGMMVSSGIKLWDLA